MVRAQLMCVWGLVAGLALSAGGAKAEVSAEGLDADRKVVGVGLVPDGEVAAETEDASAVGEDGFPVFEAYEPVASLAGDIKTAGSDTMLNITSNWAEAFGAFYPAVRVQVEGKGSSTAPQSLLEGQAQFGPMSRAMEPEEIDRLREKFGHEPTELRVAVDCVAVFVHKDCPVEELTLDQLVEIFSVSGGEVRWRDLGVTDERWRDRPVAVYGRNSASGTYKFFKDAALGKRDFKATVKEQPGSAGVILAVGNDPYAIGYSGVGYATPSVKAVNIAWAEGEEAFSPDYEHALSGDYPMARFLYVYMNHDPRSELDPLRAEFVRMIFSREGQDAVIEDGSFPVSHKVANEELGRLGLEPGF